MTSLRKKILALLLGSVLIASLLIGGAGIMNAARAVKEDSSQIMNLLCTQKAQDINRQLMDIEQSVETIYRYADNQFTKDTSRWSDQDYLDTYVDKVTDVLKNTAQSTDCAIAVYLRFNPELTSPTAGVFLSREEADGDFINQPPTDLSQYSPEDVSHVGWYYIPIENGGPTWLEPYENKNLGIDMISYVIPMYRGDTVIGIIGMDIDIRLLKESVNAISIYDSGYAFLTSSQGDLLYHKEYPDGVAQENFSGDLSDVKELLQKNQTNGEIFSYQWHGQKKRLVFHTLVNGMSLAITAPVSEIDASKNNLILQCSLILLIILAFASLLCFKLVGQMTKPLAELTQAAEQIAEGDWDVTIKCDSKDEVGVLAQTLQHTIQELNKYIADVSRLAYTDVTTGLNNRHYMEKYCQESLTTTTRDIGVIFCDLNALKYTNDHYGHTAGDKLILQFANLLKENFSNDMCCRMSGDEFVVCILQKTEKEFMHLVEQLKENNKKFNPPMASIGYCWKPTLENIDSMLTAAEDVMYQDKALFYERFPLYKR